jgi:hypothetical protein
MNHSSLVKTVAAGLCLAALANAQIGKSGVITTSETWGPSTLGNPATYYQLSGQVYVAGGATLTIQPGTVVFGNSSDDTLVIACGSVIEAVGTADAPIIFTSQADYLTWTGANPRGQYRSGASSEWGNLTILGPGYVNCCQGSNVATPAATNECTMEALTNVSPNPGGPYAGKALNKYGGGDDNFDSGTLAYCQFRYGGFTTAPGVELNGVSVGGVGRNTQIHHIEIVNNLDDGIEIWGGTVNVSYFSVINVGDDSIDIDQGYRGSLQFGLIAQGWNKATGASGSGYSDNAFEIDGAEQCNYKPVTQTTISNVTVLGMQDPGNGSNGSDHAIELRDNANVRFNRLIVMNTGDFVLASPTTANDCATNGYGCLGTRTYAQRWTDAYGSAGGNAGSGLGYGQWSGTLIDITDSLFFNNLRAAAYTAPLAPVGVLSDASRGNFIVATSPIGGTTLSGVAHASLPGKNYATINPLPVTADAQFASLPLGIATDPSGVTVQARFRGGFPNGNQWLTGWSATGDFGMIANTPANEFLGSWRESSTQGVPVHFTNGTWAAGNPVSMVCENMDLVTAYGDISIGALVFGFSRFPTPLPAFGGFAIPTPDVIELVTGIGSVAFTIPNIPVGFSGYPFWSQYVCLDDSGIPVDEYAWSNAQRHILP